MYQVPRRKLLMTLIAAPLPNADIVPLGVKFPLNVVVALLTWIGLGPPVQQSFCEAGAPAMVPPLPTEIGAFVPVNVGVTAGNCACARVTCATPPLAFGVVTPSPPPLVTLVAKIRPAAAFPMSSSPTPQMRPRQSGKESCLLALKSARPLAPRPPKTGQCRSGQFVHSYMNSGCVSAFARCVAPDVAEPIVCALARTHPVTNSLVAR